MEPIAKRPVGRPRKTPKVDAPAKPKGDGLRRAALKARLLAADAKAASPYDYPIKPPTLAPGVVPKGVDAPVLAMDANNYAFAAETYGGGGFPGFAYLSQLATRAEYRAFAATMSTELTREWLEFTSQQDDDSDSADKIKAIEEEFKRLNVRGVIQKAAENDCCLHRPPATGGVDLNPHACWALARRIMHSGYMQRVAAFLIVSKTLQQSWPIIHPDNDFKVSN